MEPKIPKPSVKLCEQFIKQWDNTDEYIIKENALVLLFVKLCPRNILLSNVSLKVSVLNDFYSTNIFKITSVAKHIHSLKIDKRISCGDISLVDDIKDVIISGKRKCFYSFATKYCSHHKPLIYPIYDRYVDKVLRYHRSKDKFASFKNIDLKNYSVFNNILERFRAYYHLECFNLKELDKFIWLFGKKYLNKNFY